jgi:hypothetical protein
MNGLLQLDDDHFHVTSAKADSAKKAGEFDRVCASSPSCDPAMVHQQTVTATKDAHLSAAETGISTVPQTPPPTSGEDLIIGAIGDQVKDAAIEAAKKKQQQDQQKELEKEKEDKKVPCLTGLGCPQPKATLKADGAP